MHNFIEKHMLRFADTGELIPQCPIIENAETYVADIASKTNRVIEIFNPKKEGERPVIEAPKQGHAPLQHTGWI